MFSKVKTIIFILSIVGVAFGQIYFPMYDYTEDDYSSSYGPRNYGDDNYDFHAAIDIAASHNTEVYAVTNGVVTKISSNSTNANKRYVLVKHTDSYGDFFVLYMHIEPDPLLTKDQDVNKDTRLGFVDYPGHDHLDIRYCIEDEFHFGTFDNSINPGQVLVGTNYTSPPQAVYRNSYSSEYGELIDGSYEFPIEEDDLGHYIEVGARVQDDELDFDEISIVMSYLGYDGVSYETDDLLNTSSIRAGHEYNSVKYEERNNCGDMVDQNDDTGHWSSSVGIYPTVFQKDKDYHVVYFRWYFDETILNSITGNIYIDIDMFDWDLNVTNVNNLAVVTCLDCTPPSGVPNPPNLISAIYDLSKGGIKLEWDESNGPSSNYFQIYRCLATETMTNKNKIAISSAWDTHFYYIDDDTSLVNGLTYKYSIAGVNSIGEGLNSNELSAFYGMQPLSVSISGPSLLSSGAQGTFTANPSHGSGTYTDYRWWERNDNGIIVPYGHLKDPVVYAPNPGTWLEITSERGHKTIHRGHNWDFTLKCEVTDSQGATATNEHSVIVSGANAPASENGKYAIGHEKVIPDALTLYSNYPNPFNPSTTINFGLSSNSLVKLRIYSSSGQLVATILNGFMSKGYHKVKWNGTNDAGAKVATGIYVYELKAGDKRLLKKMLYTK